VGSHESRLLDLITGANLRVLFCRVRLLGGFRKENVGAFISSIDIDNLFFCLRCMVHALPF
jgi:hypothetical protein